MKVSPLVRANVIVFIGGGCIMVLELIASRILAPYIGVSLYTWTSIIGVVLAAIALGNYAGGKLADKYPSPLALGGVFLVAAATSLIILPLTLVLAQAPLPVSMHLMSRAVLYTLLVFALPVFLMGMISPLAIKLTLKDLGTTGSVAGTIYAVSTAGSIIGTFATGFFLISWLGTRTIVWIVALILLVTGVVIIAPWKSLRCLLAVVGILALFAVVILFFGDSFRSPFYKESNYYAIQVIDTDVDGTAVKALSLDRLVHSYINLRDPTSLTYDYERIFAELTYYLTQNKPDFRALLMGAGGYSFCRYLEIMYPQSSLEAAEIDPAVTQTAHEALGLPRTTQIKTYHQDARMFLAERKVGPKYDLAFADAFNDMSVPFHLTTREFNNLVKAQLTPDGFYMLNIIDDFHNGSFLISMAQTLKLSFAHVYLFTPEKALEGSGPGTYVLVASDRVLDWDDFGKVIGAWRRAQEEGGKSQRYGEFVKEEELLTVLQARRPVPLTDDYVPVDNMVAFIFR